jgi:hypothetical protein
MKPVPDKAQWHKVPPGARAGECNGHERGGTCRARIFWIRSANGRPLPVDCDVEGGSEPSANVDESQAALWDGIEPHEGFGVSHFQTCPDVKRFAAQAGR